MTPSPMPEKKKTKAGNHPIPEPLMESIREQMEKEAAAKARKSRKPAKKK